MFAIYESYLIFTVLALSKHIFTALAWALSKHIGTISNTRATINFCYAQQSYMGTIFNNDQLLAEQCPPSKNQSQSSEDGVCLPMWRECNTTTTTKQTRNKQKKTNHTRNPLTLWNAFNMGHKSLILFLYVTDRDFFLL